MGKHVLSMLKFAIKYPGWQGYDRRDRATVRAVRSLVRDGLIEVNEFYQFRLIKEE